MGFMVDYNVPHVLPDFLKGLVLRWCALTNDSEDDTGGPDPREAVTDPEDATVVTSQTTMPSGLIHKVVLDIDFPAYLIPSSTEGHYHLVMDRYMTWGRYMKLLNDLADAGIIQRGYASASIARGYSSIRLPWIKKVQ